METTISAPIFQQWPRILNFQELEDSPMQDVVTEGITSLPIGSSSKKKTPGACQPNFLLNRKKRVRTALFGEPPSQLDGTANALPDNGLGSSWKSIPYDSDDNAEAILSPLSSSSPILPSSMKNLLSAPLKELNLKAMSNLSVRRRHPLKISKAPSKARASSSPQVDEDNKEQASIMSGLSLNEQNPNLIADFSAEYALPRCRSKHADLQAISPRTMSRLLDGEFAQSVASFHVIDCRYPYEYSGGHIQGAENIYTKSTLTDRFLSSVSPQPDGRRHVIIFHCEFSSERAPRMYRHLREADRTLNAARYPKLHFPEIYLLEGGYKSFYELSESQCVPRAYKPMLHSDHAQDLKFFRSKTKSLNGTRKVNLFKLR